MKKIWTSQLSKGFKAEILSCPNRNIPASCMGVSLGRTLTKALTKSINGCYTRMLRMAQNVSWRDHITNLELYG